MSKKRQHQSSVSGGSVYKNVSTKSGEYDTEEKIPDLVESPTFRNAVVEQKVNNPQNQLKDEKNKIFQDLNNKIKNKIEVFFSNGFKNQELREDAYKVLIMLFHPNKTLIDKHIQSLFNVNKFEESNY